jgi:prefoldin subunit 5
LLELGRLLNLDLKPLEELRVFAQSLDSKIAELEREATQLENQARERRRAIELLRRLREQLRVVGV